MLKLDLETCPIIIKSIELALEIEALGGGGCDIGDIFLNLLIGEIEEGFKGQLLVILQLDIGLEKSNYFAIVVVLKIWAPQGSNDWNHISECK